MIVSQEIVDILRKVVATERRLRAEEEAAAAEKAEGSKKPDQ